MPSAPEYTQNAEQSGNCASAMRPRSQPSILGCGDRQLAFVGLALTAAAALMRVAARLPRRLLTDVLASFLVAVGMYWFVIRSYA